MNQAPTTQTYLPAQPVRAQLSTRRLNTMRFGYAFMAAGLVIVKWPMFLHDISLLPVMDGVVTALLTAMSVLAFLGLRYPVAMVPILLFEVIWKLLWIAAVAVPHLIRGDMSTRAGEILFNCSFVILIMAVTPWPYVWRRFAATAGDPWR